MIFIEKTYCKKIQYLGNYLYEFVDALAYQLQYNNVVFAIFERFY